MTDVPSRRDDAARDRPGYDPAAEVTQICSDLIRIDTSNYGDLEGPGERKAAEHVAALLSEVGVEPQIFESEPGRSTVVARWGETAENRHRDPLLVHGHLDVVPARAEDWQVHPFSGEVRDDYVWGRGAVDMKDFDAMVLSALRARTRADAAPSRPLVLCFTADEEAGGKKGAGWLAQNHPETLEGCTEAIGEVGGFSATINDRRIYLVESAEKGIEWMRLRAKGHAGHGSMRHADNAVTALSAAVARLGAHEWPTHVRPAMAELLEIVADVVGEQYDEQNPEPLVRHFGSAARMLDAVLRNTTNPTMLDAGYKLNVIPGEAEAHVDGRVLPGFEEEFHATVDELLGDRVTREPVHSDIAFETSFDGALVDAMRESVLAEDPGAVVAPYLMSGGTDGKWWHKRGIRCFGFTPLRLPPDLDFTALFHGVDERVPVDALEFGSRVFDRFLDLA
ncbi:MAG TPA: M20/M25/M40 family metallo-hydrolase [Nocardioidaceae bacterium]|nr:M20/M25/M40 family metallo-hydrolase [Nocardioidaceae bacterium]